MGPAAVYLFLVEEEGAPRTDSNQYKTHDKTVINSSKHGSSACRLLHVRLFRFLSLINLRYTELYM